MFFLIIPYFKIYLPETHSSLFIFASKEFCRSNTFYIIGPAALHHFFSRPYSTQGKIEYSLLRLPEIYNCRH
jgi:hypothetical protein